MLRRLSLIVGSAALLAATVVPVAGADPTNAKSAIVVHGVCGGQNVDVVVNGNGVFAPGHVVGSTRMFIPTAFNLTFTFTPTTGSPQVETETASKAAPLKNTITCTIPLQTVFTGPQGSGTLQGTVTGFLTPR